MTIHALLLLGGASLALASVASAQSVDAPAANPNPPATASPPTISAPRAVPGALDQPDMPPQRIQAVVRASGFAPVGPPARRGDRYVQRALDPDAVPYRLVIDARSARIVSARPLRAPRPFGYGLVPYRLYLSPYRAAYGRYFGPPPDDFGYGYGAPHPPRSVPTARHAPPQTLPPPQAHQLPSPQPSPTAQAPLPRPKPYVMEATGSIPVGAPSPRRQKTTEPQKAAESPASAPQTNGGAAMPPVAPLD